MNETALKERIKVIAKDKGIAFNEAWKQLLLERFLARLSRSNHQEHFIFKGGMLLAQRIEIGRETTDLDFLVTRIKSEMPSIEAAFREIIAAQVDDGFAFTWGSLTLLTQPHMDYPGFRASLSVALGKMRDKIQIDIGVGDKVEPIEERFHLVEYKGKPIFDGEIRLLAYPVETIFAEKLETIVLKGDSNSRMKDYHDLLLMIREPGLLPVAAVRRAVPATFRNRGTRLHLPIEFDEKGVALLERLWSAHVGSLGAFREKLALPEKIMDVLAEINAWLSENGIKEISS